MIQARRDFVLRLFGTLAVVAASHAAQAQQPPALDLPTISAQEALERSRGRVLLHFGQGVSREEVSSTLRNLVRRGLTTEAYQGGPANGIEMYFYGNRIPHVFSDRETAELAVIALNLAKRHGIIR